MKIYTSRETNLFSSTGMKVAANKRKIYHCLSNDWVDRYNKVTETEPFDTSIPHSRDLKAFRYSWWITVMADFGCLSLHEQFHKEINDCLNHILTSRWISHDFWFMSFQSYKNESNAFSSIFSAMIWVSSYGRTRTCSWRPFCKARLMLVRSWDWYLFVKEN